MPSFDEENIVTFVIFGCGVTFYHDAPPKVGQSDRERNNNSSSCKKPKCIPFIDQHKCSIDEEHFFNVLLNQYNFWDMDPTALRSLHHTNDRDCMSTGYPQAAAQQPRRDLYRVFPSLRNMDSKKERLRVGFAFFQKIYLPDGRLEERVPTVEVLSFFWKAGASDGIPLFLMNCSCI